MDAIAAAGFFTGNGCVDVQTLHDPVHAVERFKALWERSVGTLRDTATRLNAGVDPHSLIMSESYPFFAFGVQHTNVEVDPKAAYGVFRNGPGLYWITASQPATLAEYYREQLEVLMQRYKIPVLVGRSPFPMDRIPIEYALDGTDIAYPNKHHLLLDHANLEYGFNPLLLNHDEKARRLRRQRFAPGQFPLHMYDGVMIDYNAGRTRHYTGMDVNDFGNIIVLTNFKALDFPLFIEWARAMEATGNFELRALDSTLTGNGKDPKRPALHLRATDSGALRRGISFWHIDEGPTNAGNLVDCIALLRPDVIIMKGIAGGLHAHQGIGEIILATGYEMFDGLSQRRPVGSCVAPLREVNTDFLNAARARFGTEGDGHKARIQQGPVATVADRQHEVNPDLRDLIADTWARAVEQESGVVGNAATLARIAHGALLLVSDLPHHGRGKLSSMSSSFFEEHAKPHFQITVEAALSMMNRPERYASRSLRRGDDPPFR